MNSTFATIIYTADPDFERKARAYLESTTRLRHISSANELESKLHRQGAMVVLFDLRGERSKDILFQFREKWPETILIAAGEARSEPARLALEAGALSIENVDSPHHLQSAVHNAVALLELREENRLLKEENSKLKHAVEKAAAKYPRTTVKINMGEKDIPEIKGDSQALAECFENLIQNAIEAKSSDRELKIKITFEEDEQETPKLAVAIQDNGKGISPEILEDIFSPFCTTKAQGMGLGLPVAQRIVEDHNGTLDIDPSDSGTTVYVSLPLDAGAEISQRPATAAEEDSKYSPREADSTEASKVLASDTETNAKGED